MSGGGGPSSLAYLDLNQLKRWVYEVFGDKELSDEMGKEIEKNNSYVDTAGDIRQLMRQRLNQCKKIG